MNTRPARIFVVEDNEPDLLLIREALRMAGLKFEITLFKDGSAALAGLERIDNDGEPVPDLIFLDLNLPRISGLEVLVTARSKTLLQNVPIVILTSSQSHDDRSQSLGLGATAYLTKPLELDEFLTVVGHTAMQLLSKPLHRHA